MSSPPSWARVKPVIEAALERPPDERAAFVRQACSVDHALRAEVESLLTAIEHAGGLIERPALASLLSKQIVADPPAALAPGDPLGPHHIVELVGAGGMGEVYRARDSRLDRDVALKVLPHAFASDAAYLARFRREAQMLAALNHSNIATIHGLEESNGRLALVLEFVEGPTLADLVANGPLPIVDVLRIAKQIADGLAAAHSSGIVHRDLKPANIKLRPDGTVKILDFGLAKAVSLIESHPVASGLPVASPVLSHAGAFIGTAAYMSPEQVVGKPVDQRSDIWAFGCVLYEIATGRRAFRAETVRETVAAVLLDAPDWSALPRGLPARVVALLHRCLEKDAERRLRSIADARIEIDSMIAAKSAVSPATRARTARRAAIATIVAAALALWGWLALSGRSPAAGARTMRLLIGLPPSEPLAVAPSMPLGIGQLSIAIAPDGSRVAYVLERGGVRQLYLRALDEFDEAPLAGTEGAFGPFFSPDGRWIGFFAENKLKKVALAGGRVVILCDAPNPYGGSWGTDGTIIFAAAEGQRPGRVHEAGAACQRVPIKDDRGSWRHPHMLPGGRAAIVSNPLLGIGVLSLESGEFRVLVESGSGGRYAPTGHLVFARHGALLAAPFDVKELKLSGPEAVILNGVRTEGPLATPQAAFSRTGTLVYASGAAAGTSTPVWVNRQGKVQSLGMTPRAYGTFSLSPDGTHLAIVITDKTSDLWVQDLVAGTLTRLTTGAQVGTVAWTPDGARVTFTSRRDPAAVPSWVARDGTGKPEPIFASSQRGTITSFSPDGRLATLNRRAPATGLDIWVSPVSGETPPRPFLQTRFTEVGGTFSPDGRWIAYVSDESGQYEVYVRSYPPGADKWQVSAGGGEEGIWSRDGRELIYRNGDKWMAVALTLRPSFAAQAPRLLFEGPYLNVSGPSYDLSPDGQRLLLLEPTAQNTPVSHLNVVVNWFEDVKAKARSAQNSSPRE